ncbi:MAG: filamentous hemagglutinin N-terminal domain-containing protein, partial [Desulfobacteraceae bacterium]
MILNKLNNKRFSKIVVMVLSCIFTIYSTSVTAWGAGLLPGFYGSTSANITAPQINSLPSLRNIVQGVSSLENIGDNQLIIHQNEKNAIIDWDSFDIGVNAWTHFEQQNNGSWKVLNRIYDQDPSLIYGKLTSDGHVYLINQNGIFFSPNSKVNVGSLVASSLNISDDDFLDGTLSFIKENYISPGETNNSEGVVSNHGDITTDDGGSVFLLGTVVENDGEISAYLGWAGLAAGDEITVKEIIEESSTSGGANVYKRVYVTENPGLVQNFEDGTISADLGTAGMYGGNVIQNGIIRSETSATSKGSVELRASDKIVLGEGSLTSTPVSDSTDTYNTTIPMLRGNVYVGALYSGLGADIDNEDSDDDEFIFPDLIDLEGTILAPYGQVDLKAINRIYLGKNSIIDVSGLWVTRPVSDKSILVQLNSVELTDDYGQKDGDLKGKKLTISTILGSNIGNVSSYILNGTDETAREKSTMGGEINLFADSGDIIFREGALLDASGGGVNYSDGFIDSAKLVSINNIVYDIDNAPEWETYKNQFLGEFTQKNERYGSKTYSGIYYGSAAPLKNYVEGFQEGSNAGTIVASAPVMILDGTIDASVTKGLYQTNYSAGLTTNEINLYEAMGILVPTGGTLLLGGPDTSVEVHNGSYKLGHIVEKITVDSGISSLSGSFNPEEDLFPEDREGITFISSDLINNAGLNALDLRCDRNISISKDEDISLLPGGAFSAESRSMIVEGGVSVPGGTITLKVKDNQTSDYNYEEIYIPAEEIGRQRLFLGPESSLSTAGEKIDNSEYGINNSEYKTGLLKGGTISISETISQEGSGDGDGVIISRGAYIDVSGGYSINSKGNVSGGSAGTLDIGGASVILDGEFAGYSIPGKKGGTINIHSGSISILPETDA